MSTMSQLLRFLLGLVITITLFFLALFTFSISLTDLRTVQLPLPQWVTTLVPFSLAFPSQRLSTDSDYVHPSSSYHDLDVSDWNLTLSPSPFTTENLIFNTASSLLQHWPNARYRNGHAIIPGRIPLGTLFYHGRSSPDMIESSRAGRKIQITPGTQEWVATDPEHSLMFCGIEGGADVETTKTEKKQTSREGATGSDCWFITLVTTRELRVLYFDGSSAAKMIGGSMDSQDVIAYRDELEKEDHAAPGWDDPGRIFGEVERLRRLCKWVEEKGLGVDGFVRMEMDFEVMLCDMSSGMDVLSFVNLAHSANPKSPSNFFKPEPQSGSTSQTSYTPNPRIAIRNFELVHSASQHNGFPGEMKVKLDMDGLVTFYDQELVKSRPVGDKNQVVDRWTHQVRRTDKDDAKRVIERLEEVLVRQKKTAKGGSGIDWQLLLQMLIQRYASRLETLQYLLGSKEAEVVRTDTARVQTVFDQLEVALSPFILADAAPDLKQSHSESESESASSSLEWASSVYQLCSTTHTLYLHSPHLLRKMTKSERTLLKAVEGTNREICRVLVGIWAEGVENGLGLLNMYHIKKGTTAQMESLRQKWEKDLNGLMDWLDWSVWQRCRPACGPEEICYMPTWPYFAGTGGPPAGPAQGPNGMATSADGSLTQNDWERPSPICIRRIAPYKF